MNEDRVSKHTAGPWEIEHDPLHYDTRSIVTAGAKERRAGVGQQMIVHVGGWAKTSEQEANAHLISAAPDLREALEYAVEVMGCYLGEDHPKTIQARTALAKARGER